jgi:hypothetical protein
MNGRWWAAVLVVLAGCSASSGGADGNPGNLPKDPGSFDDLGATHTDSTGVVLGVVVDRGIRPVAAVKVTLFTTPSRSTDTDADGRFAFGDVVPGSYTLTASHPSYRDEQTTVEVAAGAAEPQVTRIQIEARFSRSAFSVPFDFEGFIECGYEAFGVTSLCLNDYETLVVPDIPPTLKTLIDRRGYVTQIDGGWQTSQFELEWTPSAQGTSQEMFALASFWNRTANDWYGLTGGTSPVILRFEVNETYPGAAGSEERIPPEGRKDMYVYGGIQAASDAPVAVGIGVEQRFHIYQHIFYYGKPPANWSFVNGDKPPF